MRKIVLVSFLTLSVILTVFCGCSHNERNDLEILAKGTWIEPQAKVFSFEATDKSTEESLETETDISDETNEAVPAFSVTSDVVSDISGIISQADSYGVVSDTVLGISDSQSTENSYVWIPKSGKKYHSKAECSNMSDPAKVTVQEAESSGYTKCKRCY